MDQQQIEVEIRAAFQGVTRVGGTSWSEATAIDIGDASGTPNKFRDMDRESKWEDLIEDDNWVEDPGIGGFPFLDPVGYRYYIAPAMIRSLRNGGVEGVANAVTINTRLSNEWISMLNEQQKMALAHAVRFLVQVHESKKDELYGEQWKYAYNTYWKQWDRNL